VGGIGIPKKKGRDGGINRKKWAGKRDLRTLLWTLVYDNRQKNCLFDFADFVVFSLNISHKNSKTTPNIHLKYKSIYPQKQIYKKHKQPRQTAKVSPLPFAA